MRPVLSLARRAATILGVTITMLAVLPAFAGSAAEPIRSGEYGRDLVSAAAIPVAPFLNGDPWTGAKQRMDSTKNPYTIVVTVEGTAKADGDVSMLWTSGWQTASGNKLQPAMGRPVVGVKAGEHVVVRRAGPPGQFIDDKDAAPAVALVRVDNLQVEQVSVEVWSGFPKMNWMDWLRTPFLLVGVVIVVAWLFLRR
jgi:hypothetical protein